MARSKNKERGERVKVSKAEFKNALTIFSFIKPYSWALVLGLLMLVISSLVFMVFPLAARELFNIADGKSEYNMTLPQVGMIFIVVLIVQTLSSFFRVQLFAVFTENGVANIRKALYEKLITLPIPFFEKNRVGALTSRLSSDVQQLQDVLSTTVAEFIRQIIILVVGIGYIVWTAPKLTMVMLLMLPVVILFAVVFGKKIRKESKKRQDELAATNVIVDETFQSIQAVKSFTNEVFETLRYGKAIDSVVKTSLSLAWKRGLFIAFIISILFGVIFFILYRGAVLVQAGDMTSGDLFGFILMTAIIGAAIGSLPDFYTKILKAIGASDRMMEILGEQGEIELNASADAIQLNGDVQFKNVQFAYPTRKDIPVLKGVDIDIKAGEQVAIVGQSGIGKSTILHLIQQVYDLEGESILVDGKDVNQYDLRAYRKNIGIVPQEVILFGGTILENIMYGDTSANEEQVVEAAKQANAYDFIMSFPEQFETIVGERGVKLSGGQRQRIAIARALLKDPKILLLDEATSALDAESEKVVQDALETLMKGRTTIVIAHRLSTIKDADKIIVIDQGVVAEQGSHSELSSRPNGIYSNLVQLQLEKAVQ